MRFCWDCCQAVIWGAVTVIPSGTGISGTGEYGGGGVDGTTGAGDSLSVPMVATYSG